MSIGNFIYNSKSYQDFKDKCSKLSNKGNWKKNKIGKDVCFELLTKIILKNHPIFKNLQIDEIFHETEIPLRIKEEINYPPNIGDNGIDLLIKTKK